MTRAWIEDGKIMCCSDICEGIGCPQANFSPKCKEIKSPLKLKATINKMAEYISSKDIDEDICKNNICHEHDEYKDCFKCIIEHFSRKADTE